MATLSLILAQKGSHVHSIGKHAMALDAAILMNDQRIGALVVTEADRVIGMFTERDVLRRVVAEKRDPSNTTIGEVMTKDVVCCTSDTTIDEARAMMRNRRIRHLPIIDDKEKLLGVISIGDLNAWQLDGQERTIHMLNEYVYGRV